MHLGLLRPSSARRRSDTVDPRERARFRDGTTAPTIAMKFLNTLAALGVLAAGLLATPARAGEDKFPEVGKPAPEINAKVWFNQLGAEPNLASLRGSAVMLEFWATW